MWGRAKVVREGTKEGERESEVERLQAKFHLNVFIVSASGAKSKFWHLGNSCPLPMRAKFGAPEQTYGVCIHAKFRLGWFILSPSGGKNSNFRCFFGLRHFVLSPLGTNLRKLNMDAQPQTSPIQRHQNRLCTPTRLWRHRAHNI